MTNELSQDTVDEQLKLDLLTTLVSKPHEVKLYKDDQKILLSSTIVTHDPNKITVACGHEPSDQAFKMSPQLSCHFSINNDIYFFKSKSSFTDKAIIFTLPLTLYKIQRRDNFRVYVPKNLKQQLEIVGQKHLKVTLNDLSLGGCQINIQHSEPHQIKNEFKSGTRLSLKLNLLDLNHHLIQCTVRFSKESSQTHSLICGLEFDKLEAEEIQTLQSIIFKIDRLNRQANLD